MNPIHVGEGFWNLLFKQDGIEAVALKRLEVCAKCPALVESKSLGLRCSPKKTLRHIRTGASVKGCGCVLKAKVRRKHEECPAGKWEAVFD